MEIAFKNPIVNDLIEAIKIQWRYAARKNINDLKIGVCAAILFLLLGILPEKPADIWNFITSMGIAYVIVTIMTVIGLYRGRAKWIDNCYKVINNKSYPLTEYKLTDEKIYITAPDSYFESSWTVINSYQIHNNFLFLYINPLETSCIIIKRNQLSETDFETLLHFVKERIPQKDI
jgi:hypothetical protein